MDNKLTISIKSNNMASYKLKIVKAMVFILNHLPSFKKKAKSENEMIVNIDVFF